MPFPHPLVCLYAAGELDPRYAIEAKEYLVAKINENGGHVENACRAMRPPMAKSTMWRLMKKWDIERLDSGDSDS